MTDRCNKPLPGGRFLCSREAGHDGRCLRSVFEMGFEALAEHTRRYEDRRVFLPPAQYDQLDRMLQAAGHPPAKYTKGSPERESLYNPEAFTGTDESEERWAGNDRKPGNSALDPNSAYAKAMARQMESIERFGYHCMLGGPAFALEKERELGTVATLVPDPRNPTIPDKPPSDSDPYEQFAKPKARKR